MHVTEKLVAASMLALMAGCSSWNPFASKDPKTEPAKLVELKSSIAVRDAWKYSIGKAGVYAFTPALAGSSLYVVSADGALARLDAASGRETWRVKAGSDITSSPGSDGTVVAVGAAKGAVLAFDADGKQLWKAQASSEVLTAPVVGQGVVVVRSVDNRIVGFDAKTGERKWTVQRVTPALTLRNAPGMALGGANIYVAQPGGKLLALTAATGVVRWEVVVSEPRGATELERVSDIAGTPVVYEGEVCAVTYQGKAGCFDAATGVPRWTKPISSDVGVAVDQRFVFTADDQGAVVAFSREGGQSAWKNDALARRRLSTPASYGRSVAVGDYQGYIHFLSREDGALIGRVSTDGSPIVSAPVVAGSNLIFQTQSGTVTALAVE
ncbi:outer membrane protein assembly factor BamB [Janthinobacterium sp. NKUCC08_JDC]|uniref:outer membrane protein assembly factor BamB n=1 Tax=Janthinobacterium sp. NKUCC08_JDC TaxID=2842122 RepID=UPI001C5BB14C|nr:outer membrane protein assembly factor BamB [Janthinobacterium sp. NKUCC08_JDC]MBW3497522.1 outer membrane protein assembly factor BamB [Janthinobacterium sp. NKUCC08_JDC]